MEYMKLKSVVAVAVLAVITGGLFMSCRSMCTNVKSVSGFDLEYSETSEISFWKTPAV